MRWNLALLLLVACAGCVRSDFGEGDSLCGGSGACPPGYQCGGDGRCYHTGHVPPPDAAPACVEGQQKCDGRNQQRCAGGTYVSVGSCEHACLQGFCVECAPDTRRCDENQPQRCNASGGWADEPACAPPTQQCEAGGCVAGCAPTSVRCHPTQSATQLCDANGIYRTIDVCPFLCLAGVCTGECRPGSKRCGTDQTPQTCSATGTWDSGTPCPGICSGAGVCSGECRSGATRCAAGNLLQTCDATGNWGATSPCAFVCVAGADRCSGECVPNDKRCKGNTIQTCGGDGRWADGEVCTTCTLGECKPCSDGQKQCNTGIPQLCSGGQWNNTQPAACQFLCQGGACVGECTPGTYVCAGDVSRSCGPGATYTDTTCPFVCVTATGQCGGSCDPGTKRCSADVSQTCQPDGEFNAGTSCPFGCDPGTGACTGCVADDLSVTCKNGGCGDKINNCGETVTCPDCTNPRDSCGGGNVPGKCGCAPNPNACAGKCGNVDDGCKTVSCGACPADAGVPDAPVPDASPPRDARIVDGPLAPPDATLSPPDAAGDDGGCLLPIDPCLGLECDSVFVCGIEFNCGTCPDGQTCTRNLCECTPEDQACKGKDCGPAIDGCGRTYDRTCGDCPLDGYCVDGLCQALDDKTICLSCDTDGYNLCCCEPGDNTYCTKGDQCVTDYSQCGAGCSRDPDPCFNQSIPCGPVDNMCGQQVECGPCLESTEACFWDPTSLSPSKCSSVGTPDICKGCLSLSDNYVCCVHETQAGWTPLCVDTKAVSECPKGYVPLIP